MNWFRRFTRVEMLLRNVLYISYCLPASSLRSLVPAGLPLRLVAGDRAFLSIVIMHCQQVHLGGLPFPSFNYNQLNLRTYVLNPKTGRPAVYFLKSGVTSPLISALTRLIGLPWEHNQFEIETALDERNQLLEYQSAGYWHNKFKIVASRDLIPSENLAPFADLNSAVDFLVRPLEGFFSTGSRLAQVRIQHPEIVPQLAVLKLLDFPLLIEVINTADLVLDEPHSVFFVDKPNFFIYMPPSYLKI